MQPFASGGDRRPPPLSPVTASTPSEAPVTPSSALSDSTRLGDHDTNDDLTTAGEASPRSFSPRSSSWKRRSTTQTPPPVTAAPPTIVIGNDPNPPGYGDSQFTGGLVSSRAQAAPQLRKSTAADVGSDADTAAPASSHPPKPSDAPSYLSFQSSFFCFTSDSTSRSSSSSSSSSSASAEASNASESAPPPTQPANSSGVRHARQSSVDEDTTDEASLLSSRSSPLGEREATTPTATTMAATSPPPAPAFPPLSVAMTGSTATQVLVPPHGYRTGRARGSRASPPSATSSTPSSQSLLSESEEEGGSLSGVMPREGVTRAEGATTAEAEEPVLTLRVEALDVVGGSPSCKPPSPQHSASSTAGSPLSELAAALTTTYGCPSLSQLATTLLGVDGESAAMSFHEAHTSTCVNTAALVWAARPLPLTKEAAQQQRLVSAPLQQALPTAVPPPAPEAEPVPSESDETSAHAAVAEDDRLITADAPALPPVLSVGRRRVRRKRQTAAAAMPVAVPEVAVESPPLAAVDSMASVAQAAAVYPHVQAAEAMQSAVGVPLPELATSPAPPVTPPLAPTDGSDDVPLAWLMKKRLVPTAQSGELSLGDVPLSQLFLTSNGLNGSTSSSAASSATAVLPLDTPAPDEDVVSRRGARRRNRVRDTLSAAAPVPTFPASAPTRTESAAAPEAAEHQAAGGRHVRAAREKMSAATSNAADSAAPSAVAAAAAGAVALDAKSPPRMRGTEATAPPRPRKRARTSAKRSSPSEAPPLRLWWKSVRASAAVPLAGRPCLWIELAPGYQEAHGALLRQVLVCWGRLTQSRDDEDGDAASRPGAKGSTRARKRQRSPVIATNGLAARHEGGSGAPALTRAAEVGLVVLLCPVAVPMQEALRWWTARAHLEHGYVPPLLAVSLSSSSPGASSQALFQGATAHAARLFAANLSWSLAVSCTAAGYAALARLLPLAQVFDSLAGFASALAAAVGMPAAALAASDVDAGGCDGEGLAAVLAATSWDDRGAGASLQARSFASMCGWNGLAAALQRWPRRPQLLLQHTPLDLKTSRELLKGEATSASTAALQPVWVTVGLVCPATRNEDTFSCSAQRESRVLAARPPTVSLSATHVLALCAFARAFFGLENYATSVNVLAAQARLNSRGLADYLSGYSCVTTGPLRYTVSATLRRYLHVRMAVTLAPLLSCVQGAPADPALEPASRLCDTDTMEAAARHDGEARSLGAVLTRLAHVRWRSVLPELSCTCTPRLYEQVPRTDDGTKACRHLAQLFHHFTTQQFCVVGPAAEAGAHGAALLPPSPAPPARAPLPPPPHVPPPPESVDVSAQRCCAPKQQPVEEATDTDLLVDSVPLALLYSHASSLDQDDAHDGDGGGADAAGTTEGTATPVVVHAPRRRRRPAEARARAAATPLPPASPLLSSPPSAEVSAAGSSGAAGSAAAHFHNEAVRYALRLLAQRMQESRGGDHSPNGFGESGGAPLAVPTADRERTAAGGVRRPRTRRSPVSEPEEQARALQLVEQLLRAQLSPRTQPTVTHQAHDADTRAHAHRRAGRRALALYAMRQGYPQVGHNSSATWLGDLSPITARSPPPPPPASPSRAQHPPTWHTTPRAHYGSDASSLHEPRRWTFTGPARKDGLYTHLVRSRSPPSPAVTPRAPRAAEAPRPAHSGRTKSVHEPSTPEDLLAEMRAEWAFAADPVSSSAARGAVAAGQRAAAVHRANAAFFEAFADLAREAAGRVVEVKRHRLAAQHTTEKWRAAQEAHKRASAELQDAQARLMRLEAAETQRVAAAAARDIDGVPSPPADAPLDVVALQLDAGMAEMRALKEQYATLCTRKTRLEVQVEELEQAGQNLAASLDAARQQRAQQLQQGLATSARPPSASQPASHILAGALEDLSVCLMERRGLLRHLREGASDRWRHFRALTAASQDDSHATASASSPPPSSSALLDEMAEVHTALCEGEEEALNEMEHLLLLLQRHGSSSGASGQPTQSPRVPTAGTQPAVVVEPDQVATEEST